MEYLQFGFAAAFCIILYTDQRTTIRTFSRTANRLAIAIEQMLKTCSEKKDT